MRLKHIFFSSHFHSTIRQKNIKKSFLSIKCTCSFHHSITVIATYYFLRQGKKVIKMQLDKRVRTAMCISSSTAFWYFVSIHTHCTHTQALRGGKERIKSIFWVPLRHSFPIAIGAFHETKCACLLHRC